MKFQLYLHHFLLIQTSPGAMVCLAARGNLSHGGGSIKTGQRHQRKENSPNADARNLPLFIHVKVLHSLPGDVIGAMKLADGGAPSLGRE